MHLIQVQHLSFKYPHQKPILNNLNLTFKSGTLSVITGPSGSGKSTLLKFMAGLYPQFATISYRGQISYDHQKLSQIPKTKLSSVVSMLFQDPNHQFTMKRVNEEMQFALENKQVNPNRFSGIIGRVLNRVGISQLRYRKFNQLSGGEKQKAALAVVLALNPQVILLDEPFSTVDYQSKKDLIKLLMKLKELGKTIIIVDHDPSGYLKSINHLYQVKNRKLTEVKPKSLARPHSQLKCQLPTSGLETTFSLKNLTLKRQTRTLANLVNLNFYSDHITLITGENGVGKSTLFKAMARLLHYQGKIKLYHQEISTIPKKHYFKQVTLVFQNAEDQFINLTVNDEIQLSIQNATRQLYSKKVIKSWLKKTGLWSRRSQVVYTLSGGQKKALQLLDMIIMGNPVMLLDEPFQNLDQRLLNFFIRLLKTITHKHHLTVIIISHQFTGLSSLIDYHVQFKDLTLTYKKA